MATIAATPHAQRLRRFAEILRRDVAPVGALFIASRGLVCALVLLSRLIVLPGPVAHHGGLFSVLIQSQGLAQLDIVRQGYHYLPGQQSTIAYLSMYPALVKLVSFIWRDVALSALIVSNALLLAAALLLNLLVQIDYGKAAAIRGVTFLLFSPVALYHSSAAPDSLFLALGLAALLAARSQKWIVAGLCAILLSASRQYGVFIVVPLAIEAVGGPRGRTVWRLALQLIAGAIGLMIPMMFSSLRFHDPFAPWKAARTWGPLITSPATIKFLEGYSPYQWWLFFGSVAIALAIISASLLIRLRPSYIVYAVLLTAVFTCSNALDAPPRTLAMIFPLYVSLGVLTQRFQWLYEPVLGGSAASLSYCTIVAANGYWLS